jgi:hypothetical protein
VITKKKAAYWLGVIFTAAAIAAFILAVSAMGNASTVASQRRNSLGTLAYTVNPYIYVAGAAGKVYDVDNGAALVIEINPVGTYGSYMEEFLFCGTDELELFRGKKNPIVLTFSSVAHRTVEGIGCHQLIRVDELKPTKPE